MSGEGAVATPPVAAAAAVPAAPAPIAPTNSSSSSNRGAGASLTRRLNKIIHGDGTRAVGGLDLVREPSYQTHVYVCMLLYETHGVQRGKISWLRTLRCMKACTAHRCMPSMNVLYLSLSLFSFSFQYL